MTAIRPLFAELERVRGSLAQADRILVALDYDGTLAPIAADPKAAAISPETRAILNRLAASSRHSLAVVSGRSLADLRARLDVDAIYVGNHGLEIGGGGISYVHEGAPLLRAATDHACWDLEAALAGVRGVIVERKELSATVHYRQAPRELTTWIHATVQTAMRPYLPQLFVAPARQALEIRPRLHWNKGSAVRLLLGWMNAVSPALVCAGDDRTDEDMFDILRWEVSIKVGLPRHTRAHYYVRGVPELVRFLKVLASDEVMSGSVQSCYARMAVGPIY
jgi:trehalose 6-phosphate phosphatase